MASRETIDTEVILFSHPSMFELARNIHTKCKKGKNSSKVTYLEEGIRWNKFSDDFPNLFIENVKNIASKHVFLLASFHSPQVIFEQLSVIYAIPRYMVKSFTLVLPYFPTGTMERIDLEGQIATANTLAMLLSAIPLTTQGPVQIIIYDIHAPQERFYFSETVLPRLETALTMLEDKILKMVEKGENMAIAFPDEGAHKRFNPWLKTLPESLLSKISKIICSKVRRGNQRMVKIADGDPADHHTLIIDDLVQSGSTIMECAKKLQQSGAVKVSVYVTHAVFPSQTWKQFTEDAKVKFENFWITDSLPHAYEICKHPPFKLISLDQSVYSLMLDRLM